MDQIIPSHIQIETINGACTSRCIMCNVFLSKRKPHVMSIEDYTTILNKFIPFRDNIKYISLVGYGEPLLDKSIVEKVKIARDMGFKGIGFPSNCTELTEEMSTTLIKAGLNTLICSIDGITKKTHESIKVGTDFETVVSNVKRFVSIRNKLNASTKVLIKFIYQDENKHEWEQFFKYWTYYLKKNGKEQDSVYKFHIHNCGGILDGKINSMGLKPEPVRCGYIYERMIIFSNGNVMFCCGDTDDTDEISEMNIFQKDPVEIYNTEEYKHYRKMMEEGRVQELPRCQKCTIWQAKNEK